MCLVVLALRFSFVLDLFGQQRQNVDGNVRVLLHLFQVVHRTCWKGKGTEVHRQGGLMTLIKRNGSILKPVISHAASCHSP